MIELEERRAWDDAAILLLIGPAGTGKSSLGSELAPLLKRRLVDLDQEFLRHIGDISAFMRREGYERYKVQNSMLAARIAAEAESPTLLVASSGFLTPDNPEAALKANEALSAACYSICLLPSPDLEQSVRVVVERQLMRPFARDMASEEAAIRARFRLYAGMGDLLVFSSASARDTATAVVSHFSATA